MAFSGFTKRKHSTISNGDWDRDGVKNKKDCEPLNFRKQDGGRQFRDMTAREIEIAEEWEEKFKDSKSGQRQFEVDEIRKNKARGWKTRVSQNVKGVAI